MQRKSFVRPNQSVVERPINGQGPELWRSSINYKALRFVRSKRIATLSFDLKAAAADWDPDLGPSGGWRCPEGTQFGGYITDRWGRGCGVGVFRRLLNTIGDAAEGVTNAAPDRRRRSRDANSRMRRLRRIAEDQPSLPSGTRNIEVPETPESDQPWAIEGFLNRLAARLDPRPRTDNRRRRRRNEIDTASTASRRPTLDRPSNEPALVPELRTRTRQPLLNQEDIDWDDIRWQAVRDAFESERESVNSEWRTRLRLDNDENIDQESVDNYVQQRIEAGRSDAYVARLRALADAWKAMRTDTDDNDRLVRAINAMNPRRGRAILADADRLEQQRRSDTLDEISTDNEVDLVQETELPEPESPVRTAIDAVSEEMDAAARDEIRSIVGGDDDETQDAEEAIPWKPRPFEELEFDEALMRRLPAMSQAMKLMAGINSQWHRLRDKIVGGRGSDTDIRRTRSLQDRIDQIVKTGRARYERLTVADDFLSAAPAIFAAKKLEETGKEINTFLERLDHTVPESPDQVDLNALREAADPDVAEEISALEYLVSVEELAVTTIEEKIKEATDLPIPDGSDATLIERELDRLFEAMGELTVRLINLGHPNRTADDLDYRMGRLFLSDNDALQPVEIQDALYALRPKRDRLFRRQVEAISRLISRIGEVNKAIRENYTDNGKTVFYADPRIGYTTRNRSRPFNARFDNTQAAVHEWENQLLEELQEAIRTNDFVRLRSLIDNAIVAANGAMVWNQAHERLVVELRNNPDTAREEDLLLAAWESPDALRRIEQIAFLSEILDRVSRFDLDAIENKTPLRERPGMGDFLDLDHATIRNRSVREKLGTLSTDSDSDSRYPWERSGDRSIDVDNYDYSASDTDVLLSDDVRDLMTYDRRDYQRQFGLFSTERIDEITAAPLPQREAYLREVTQLFRELTETYDGLKEIAENEADFNRDERARAAAAKNLLAQYANAARIILSRLGDRNVEERRRLGGRAPINRVLPDDPTINDIEDTNARASAKRQLAEQESERNILISRLQDLTDLELEGLIDDYVGEFIDNQRNFLDGGIDRQIFGLLMGREIEARIDAIRGEIDNRRSENLRYLDGRIVSELLEERDPLIADDQTLIDTIPAALFDTNYRALAGYGDEDLGLDEGQFQTLIMDLKALKQSLTAKYRSRLLPASLYENEFEALAQELDDLKAQAIMDRDDISVSLFDRIRAAVTVDHANESLRLLRGIEGAWKISPGMQELIDRDPEQALEILIFEIVEESNDADAVRQRLRRMVTRVDSIQQVPLSEVDFNALESPDEVAYAHYVGLERYLRVWEEDLSFIGDESATQDLAVLRVAIFAALRKLDRLIEQGSSQGWQDFRDPAVRHLEANWSSERIPGARPRNIFVDRVLSGFRWIIPQRRNQTRGQIAHLDGSPRLIENPSITDAAQAIDHVRRGGSLDEVPNQYWHVAVEGNSSSDREDRSTVFYKAPVSQGLGGLTEIYLTRDAEGRAQEQGWVFKARSTTHAVQDTNISQRVAGVLRSWMLSSMGLPLEGGGWDGSEVVPTFTSATETSQEVREFTVMPYIGNLLPAGPALTIKSVVGDGPNFEAGFTAATPSSAYGTPLDPLEDFWRRWSARLSNVFASALLDLNDRHYDNAISVLTSDGPVIFPIDLDNTAFWVDPYDRPSLMSYLKQQGSGLDRGASDPLATIFQAHDETGRGLEVVWKIMKLWEQMSENIKAVIDGADDDTLAAMLLQGYSSTDPQNRTRAMTVAKDQIDQLRKHLEQMAATQSRRQYLYALLDAAVQAGEPEMSADDRREIMRELLDEFPESHPREEMPTYWRNLASTWFERWQVQRLAEQAENEGETNG